MKLATFLRAVAAAGGAVEYAGVKLDVLHVIRGGDRMVVARTDPAKIRVIQLSDGVRKICELFEAALIDCPGPNEGDFNLTDLAALLSEGVPVGIEVPSLSGGDGAAIRRGRGTPGLKGG